MELTTLMFMFLVVVIVAFGFIIYLEALSMMKYERIKKELIAKHPELKGKL